MDQSSQPKTSPLAIASFAFGTLCLLCQPVAILAVIFGHLALSRIRKSDGALIGSGLAKGGLVMGYIGIVIFALLVFIAIPRFSSPGKPAASNTCINNLRQMNEAIQRWALDNKKTTNDVPTLKDITPYLKDPPLTCPEHGTYTVHHVGQPPTCSIPGHKLPE